MKRMPFRRKRFLCRAFVKLFLFQLLLCTGFFSNITLCVNKDGSFHVEFYSCEKAAGKDGFAGNALPIKAFEHSENATSDPCDLCTESQIFTCVEDCENLAPRNAGGNLRDLLSASTIKTPVFINQISHTQAFYRLRQPIVANIALDSLQTVVLLN